jgi:uncharacterized protein YbcV (DUF1398 family)
MEQSQARKLTFPEVVRRLLDAGVESYFCDLAIRQETFYMRDLKTPVQKMTPPTAFVAEEFLVSGAHCSDSWRSGRHHSLSRIFQALRRCRVIAYWAFLTGRKVMYFGRRGEIHVEEFGRPKQ